MKALLTSEWILSTETLEGFKSETDTEGGNNWEDSDTKWRVAAAVCDMRGVT